jgi:hypothetical protein
MNSTKIVTTRENIFNVVIPQETKSYKPIFHKQLIDMTLEQADKIGFELVGENYSSGDGGKIVTAYYDFKVPGLTNDDMGFRIAWQNSYNKKISLKYAAGASVFVCTNGCFSGSLGAFRRKHSGDVQVFTPSAISEYFIMADEIYKQLQGDKHLLKNVEITKKTAAELIGDLYINEDLIKETQVAIIKKEMTNPSFEYNAEGSAWEIYNHVTHSLKTVYASDYLDAHKNVHNFFMDKFGMQTTN